MLLVSDLAQPIVDKTMTIIKKNVNIMDEQAIIIASGDPSLIGVFHEGAYLVIEQGKPIEVYPDGVGSLKGVVRPGVNLPIAIGGRTVGVVGVSGHPDEIRSNVELVKVMVESMLEQMILKEQLDLEARANDSFLNDLLTEKAISHEDLFINRAGILGYDINVPRYAIVIDIDNFREIVEKKNACQGDIRAELALQQLKEKVLSSLKKVAVPGGNGIVIFVGGDEFVILQSGEEPVEGGQRRREINVALAAIKDTVKAETGLAITIGVGQRYDNFKDYYRTFREGRSAIKIGKCLEGPGPVFWIDELQMENLIASIPEGVLRSYVAHVLGKIIQRESTNSQKEIFRTLGALCHNTLNPTKAAREMFIHRNTILFRLEKLYKETGYQPAEVFADAIELYIALLAQKFLKAGIFGNGP
jgi:carbohydrate diacid regulator